MTFFYKDRVPSVGTFVVATVVNIKETAVYCILPAYGNIEVMLPTSEINIRRGKRVKDYVSVGQQIVVDVIRDDAEKIDVSMKNNTQEHKDAVLNQFHRDSKVSLLVRTAGLQNDVIYPLQDLEDERFPDALSVFEAIRASSSPDFITIPDALHDIIMARLPAPTYRADSDVTIRFGIFHDGAARVSAELVRLAALPGIDVIIVAPPKYHLTATAGSREEADALLAAAIRTIPEPC